MTSDQEELRAERVAMFIHDMHKTEAEAQEICDKEPDTYGIRGIDLKQEELFKRYF